MANSTGEIKFDPDDGKALDQRQAWAWAYIVSYLMHECGLDHNEPGENMVLQVQNFLKRKIKDVKPTGE